MMPATEAHGKRLVSPRSQFRMVTDLRPVGTRGALFAPAPLRFFPKAGVLQAEAEDDAKFVVTGIASRAYLLDAMKSSHASPGLRSFRAAHVGPGFQPVERTYLHPILRE